jgi:hypothetical protein
MSVKDKLEHEIDEYDKRNQSPNSQQETKIVKEENRVIVTVTLC